MTSANVPRDEQVSSGHFRRPFRLSAVPRLVAPVGTRSEAFKIEPALTPNMPRSGMLYSVHPSLSPDDARPFAGGDEPFLDWNPIHRPQATGLPNGAFQLDDFDAVFRAQGFGLISFESAIFQPRPSGWPTDSHKTTDHRFDSLSCATEPLF